MHPVAVFDILFFLSFLGGLVVLLKGWKRVFSGNTKLLLAGLIFFNIVYSFCLSVEWLSLTNALESLEDFVGVLLPLLWAFVIYAMVQDITRQDLAESENRFRTLVANIPGVVYRCRPDEDWTMSYMSETIEKISGYPYTDFIDNKVRSFASIIHLEDRQLVKDITFEQVEKGRSFLLEYRIITSDGKAKWIFERGRGVKDEDGNVLYLDGALFDITDRKRAEESLRYSEMKLHAILDHHYQLTGLLDSEGRLLAVNRTALEFIGAEESEVIGHYFWETPWWGSSQESDVRLAIKRAARGKFVRIETEHITAEGEERNFDFSLSPIFDDNGNVIYLVPEGRDITEMKQSEQALRESEERYRLLFASSNDGLLFLDGEEFKLLDCNQKVCEMLGCSRDKIIGETPFRFFPELQPDGSNSREKGLEILNKVMQGEAQLFEWKHIKYDGTPIDMEVSLNRLELSDGVYVQTIWRDITERKEAERQRENLFKILASKNEELEDIVYVSSHDLRTPLVNIQGYAGLLRESCQRLEELITEAEIPQEHHERIWSILRGDIQMSLDFVNAGASRLDLLQRGLLRVCRLGRTPLKVKRLDINAMFSKIVKNLQAENETFNAEINISVVPDCFGDEGQVLQLFTHLVDNAVKYLGPVRKGVINVSGQTEGGMSTYCIEDNGIGISPEHYDKVFEVFYRLDPEGAIQGEGLGLTIARRLAARHNGKLWLESERGKGSRFFASLPNSFKAVSSEMSLAR